MQDMADVLAELIGRGRGFLGKACMVVANGRLPFGRGQEPSLVRRIMPAGHGMADVGMGYRWGNLRDTSRRTEAEGRHQIDEYQGPLDEAVIRIPDNACIAQSSPLGTR